MLEDVHLIEACLAADRIIVSQDEAVRRLFGRAAGNLPGLRNILWLNPADPDENVADWLRGADVSTDPWRLA